MFYNQSVVLALLLVASLIPMLFNQAIPAFYVSYAIIGSYIVYRGFYATLYTYTTYEFIFVAFYL
jgi:hypothetical protein